MKKLFLSMLAVGGLMFTSCEKDEIDALNSDLLSLGATVEANEAASNAADAEILAALDAFKAAQSETDADQDQALADAIAAFEEADAAILENLESSKEEIFGILSIHTEQLSSIFENIVPNIFELIQDNQDAIVLTQNELTKAKEELNAAIIAGDLEVAQAAARDLSNVRISLLQQISSNRAASDALLAEARAALEVLIETGDTAIAASLRVAIRTLEASIAAGDTDVRGEVSFVLNALERSLRAAIASNDGDIATNAGNISDNADAISDNEDAIQANDGDIAQLNATLGTINSDVEQLQADISALSTGTSSSVTALQASLADIQRQIDNLPADDDSALASSLSDLQAAVAALRAEVTALSTQVGNDPTDVVVYSEWSGSAPAATVTNGDWSEWTPATAISSVQSITQTRQRPVTSTVAAYNQTRTGTVSVVGIADNPAPSITEPLSRSIDAVVTELDPQVETREIANPAYVAPADPVDVVVYGNWTGTAPAATTVNGTWSAWTPATAASTVETIDQTRSRSRESVVAAYNETRTGVVSVVGEVDDPAPAIGALTRQVAEVRSDLADETQSRTIDNPAYVAPVVAEPFVSGGNAAVSTGEGYTLSVSGGTAPYTWAYSHPTNGASAAFSHTGASYTSANGHGSAGAGTHVFTVTDANSNSVTINVVVTVADPADTLSAWSAWSPAFGTRTSNFSQTRTRSVVVNGNQDASAPAGALSESRNVIVTGVNESQNDNSTEATLDQDVNNDGDKLDAVRRSRTNIVYSANHGLGSHTVNGTYGAYSVTTDNSPADPADTLSAWSAWGPAFGTQTSNFTQNRTRSVVVNGNADATPPAGALSENRTISVTRSGGHTTTTNSGSAVISYHIGSSEYSSLSAAQASVAAGQTATIITRSTQARNNVTTAAVYTASNGLGSHTVAGRTVSTTPLVTNNSSSYTAPDNTPAEATGTATMNFSASGTFAGFFSATVSVNGGSAQAIGSSLSLDVTEGDVLSFVITGLGGPGAAQNFTVSAADLSDSAVTFTIQGNAGSITKS